MNMPTRNRHADGTDDAARSELDQYFDCLNSVTDATFAPPPRTERQLTMIAFDRRRPPRREPVDDRFRLAAQRRGAARVHPKEDWK